MATPEIEIKIVRPRIEDRTIHKIDFDDADAREWGRFAIESRDWRTTCEISNSLATSLGVVHNETLVVIASPTGRVGLWFGYMRAWTRAGFVRTTSKMIAADSALFHRPAARLWDPKAGRLGTRDVSAFALAACRVLHAKAFNEPVVMRDQLLAEYANLASHDRPSTRSVLNATDETLLAASALLAIEDYAGAKALIKSRGKFSRLRECL